MTTEIFLIAALPALVIIAILGWTVWRLQSQLDASETEVDKFSRLFRQANALHDESAALADELVATKRELVAKDGQAMAMQNKIETLMSDLAKKHAVASRFEERIAKQREEIAALRRSVTNLEVESIAQDPDDV